MKKRSYRRDWPLILKEFAESDLEAKDFCKLKDISNSAFYKARIKHGTLQKRASSKANSQTEFIDITPPNSPSLVTQKSTPTLRITSKDGHLLEVFL
jgi:hypothetical protein